MVNPPVRPFGEYSIAAGVVALGAHAVRPDAILSGSQPGDATKAQIKHAQNLVAISAASSVGRPLRKEYHTQVDDRMAQDDLLFEVLTPLGFRVRVTR